jgi:hypothetical protein
MLAACLPPGIALALETSLPDAVGALAVTDSSHPFLAAAHQARPLDLAEQGYVEEEFLVSGRARVFDWPEHAGAARFIRSDGERRRRWADLRRLRREDRWLSVHVRGL